MSSSSRLSPTQRPTSPTLTSNTASVTSGAADNKDVCQSRIPQTTAFTVHFDNDNKFTKRHVRNLSLPISKLYDGKMTSDPNKSPAVNGRTPEGIRNGLSVGATSRISRGNHSEGYFSSDAEAEDDPAHPKLFVAKLRTTGKKVSKPTNLAQEKKVEQQRRVTTPIVKDDQDIVLKRNVKQKPSEPMEPDEDADGGDSSDAASEVSEAGTYTIDKEKERENVDVITARLNIDNSFGVSQQTITANQDPDPNNFDSAHSSLSWVNDWASHVVEHNSLTLTGVQEHDHSKAVSPVQQKQSVPIHGGPISKIPSPISNVRAQFRLTNTGTTLPPIERTSLTPATINKQSPRTRRTTTVQTTNTNISNRQSHRDEYSDSSLETESFLLATERVVSAMAARVSLSMDSGGESDVDTSHSCNSKRQIGSHSISMPTSTLVTPTAASGGIQSDSSASESGGTSRKAVMTAPTSTPSSITTPTTTTRYNRAFSLRRGRLDKATPTGTGGSNISIGANNDSPVVTKLKRTPDTQRHSTTSSNLTQHSHVGATTSSRLSKTPSGSMPLSRSSSTVSHTLSTSATNVPHRSQSFTRTDCGRYSMRSVKPNQTNSPLLSNQNKDVKKKGNGARSNSTLSSREVEFQNWKRRKSYDPMKAAAEGKKKEAAKKQQQTTTGGNVMISSSSSQPKTPSNPVLRSASFHGTRQLAIPSSSDEDDDCEEEEEEGEDEEVVPSAEEYEEEEEDWKAPAAPRTSLESTPRGSHVSLYSNTSNSSLRSRPKLEGVDNLVISALSGLSGKVKVGSCNLLKKLRHLYDEDNPKAHQLTAEIEQLEVSEPGSPHHAAAAANNNSNTTSNANRSPSRELSTALRNLKRIESVIKVLDNVLFDNEDFN